MKEQSKLEEGTSWTKEEGAWVAGWRGRKDVRGRASEGQGIDRRGRHAGKDGGEPRGEIVN